MKLIVRYLLTMFLLNIYSLGYTQDKSNKGKEFWLGYGHNILFTFPEGGVPNSQTMVLYLSAEQAATVTVSVNSTGFTQTVNIPANTVDFSVVIPKSGVNDARLLTEGLSARGIHIVSNVPIVAYAHEYGSLSSGATMLMPVETYGYTYYSLNFTQTSNYANAFSWFYIVASENNTRLEITPSDSTEGGWEPNMTYTVNLNKGEIYNVFGKQTGSLTGKDMSGSKVVSVPGADGNCHPVAVFSGSSRNDMYNAGACNGNGGEFMMQQIFPANAWGTRYVTYHTINNPGATITTPFLNKYRVAVRNPSTIVKRNGTILTGLVNNFYYEFESNSGDFIESDGPILVAQYMVSANECTGINANPIGDPEIIFLSPIEQGVKNAIFYNTRNQNVNLNYANIIVPTAGVSSLLFDGLPVSSAEYTVHPVNNNYTVIGKRLLGAGAQHSISCDSAFVAINYGVGTTESYAYNIGTLVNNLNAVSEIKNTFNTTGLTDTFTCTKSPVRLFVKLAYPATSIHWKLSQVTTMTPNADSITVNPIPVRQETINNRTYYVYSLQQDFIFNTPGTYFIPVSYTHPDIDACNNTENMEIKVIVKPGPIADYTVSSPSCLADSIHFTGVPIANGFILNNYLWNFDDLSTQTSVDAIKKFSVAGSQNIRYRVIATNGCLGDTTKTITVFDTPQAAFSVQSTICQNDSIALTDNSTLSFGNIVKWEWDFGDGIKLTTTNNNPVFHHYTNPGNYSIALIVTSDSSCRSDTTIKQVVVNPSPVAKFGYSRNICIGDSVLFSDSSIVNGSTIANWNWNFGDGNILNAINNLPFYYSYSSTGVFTVKLVVSSTNGCVSDTFQLNISVANKPAATISYTGKPCIDSLQNFVSSFPVNNVPAPSYYWDFGDGQFLNSASNIATHAYLNTQSNITIRHVVSAGIGCSSDTVSIVIPVINPNPVASFNIIADTACVNMPVQFTSVNTGVTQWSWNFGNGNGTNIPPFTRSYPNAGNYNVTLRVTNADGCSSAIVGNTVQIYPNPLINAGPDKFITPGGTVQIEATNSTPGNFNYLWTPSTALSSTSILNPVASPDVTTEYMITAVDADHYCIATDKVVISVITGLFVPNAFTPNNDGLNDKWQIPGLAVYPDALVTIYNRNGAIVYQTKDYYNHPWDGTFKNMAQPTSVFVYLIKVNDPDNRILKGTITLIR